MGRITKTGERGFTTRSKYLNPAFEGFGMDVQDTADRLGILTAVQEQNRVQALGNTTIISLFETAPHVLALGVAQGKQLLAHDPFL